VRIAVSGAHRTGKTTLVAALLRALPEYIAIEEPYHRLEEEGHVFAAMPSLEDFELQLGRSIECLEEPGENRIFDRCPADFLAYLLTHPEADAFDLEASLARVEGAMRGLDLIVFVPIEPGVHATSAEEEDPDLRDRVDEELRDIVLADRWGFDFEALEVTGTPDARLRLVLARIGAAGRD